MRKLLIHCLLILLLTVRGTAQNGGVFTPRSDQPFQPLSGFLQLLEDVKKTLTIEELLQKGDSAGFHRFTDIKTINTRSAWWLKLELLPEFSSDSFYIGLPQQNMSGFNQGNDKVDIWVYANRNANEGTNDTNSGSNRFVAHYETGTLTPLSVRPVAQPINHNLFPLSLKANQPLTIYWRIQRTHNFEPLQLNFILQHASLVDRGASAMDRLAWFYTGVMFILFIFGLVFLLITRERAFGWFTSIAAILCIHMQMLEPKNSLTLWLVPEHPVYQFHLFAILTSSFGILILQFTRSFSQLKKLLPKWDKLVIAVMIYIGVQALATMILLQTAPEVEFPVFILSIAFAAIMVIGVRLMFTDNLYARWSGFALLWLFVFQSLGILWNNDVIPGWFPNPWTIAQVGMMIILFFALAYRFKQSAKEKAEAAKVLEMDTIRSRFFANISHEFRTPLTLMLGPLKQLEEDTMDEKQKKKYIRLMRRNGERLLQLINQLLDLSKLESGKMELRVRKTDITGLLKAIAHSFESLAEQNQVNYRIHFPEQNIIGYADRDKLEKIVVNLLSNAFRFTASGGDVSFSVEQVEERLRLTVQDNGVGMPKEQLDKIFDRFHQVAGTEGGTGIGLALAKELLQLHKGQISVQSEMGKGSSFRVSIPVADSFYSNEEKDLASLPTTLNSATAPVKATDDIPEEEETFIDSSLPLVLIVEDNADLQLYIGDTLRPHFRVELASNGKIGLQQAIDLVPDCIISDIMMPEMNGIELCEQLKKEAVTSHIPVILLTAKAGSNSRIEGLQTGADDYLVKPFDGTELIVRIRNLIEQRKQLRERYSRQVISVQPEATTVVSTEQVFIQQVRTIIEENIDNSLFNVEELAAAIHLSRSQLHRKLKALTGQAPNELIRNYRLERAMQLLRQQAGTVTEIAYQTGFSSAAYFTKCFGERYGKAPGEVRGK